MRKKRTKEERLAYQRGWRKAHAAQHLALTNRWRDEHRDEINESRREWTRANPERVMLSGAKKRAREAGVAFNLELGDIQIPTHCPVLGIVLKTNTGRLDDSSPSLDRHIPILGYVKGNVSVISMRANRLKSDASISEWESLVAWMRGR